MSATDLDLADRVAIVTGAGTGIGRATAIAFAHAGANVVAVGRRQGPLDETVAESADAPGDVIALVADVAVPEQAEQMVATTVDRFGRLDAAANCAAILGSTSSIFDMTPDEFDHVIANNLRGMWLAVKHEMTAMRQAGGGAIVNVSSLNAVRGGALPYAASKAGVEGLTRSAAVEGGRHGIRVVALRSGFVWTPMLDAAHHAGGRRESLDPLVRRHVPLGRMAEPAETAATIVWLCSPAASYVTGTCIEVDGGAMAT